MVEAAAGLDGKDEPSSVSVSGLQASSSSSSSSFSSSGSLKPFARDGMSPTDAPVASCALSSTIASICTDGDETVVVVALLSRLLVSSVRGFLEEDVDSVVESLAGDGDVLELEHASSLFEFDDSLERRRSMNLRRQLLPVPLLLGFFVGDTGERVLD
jgi:hypothetical protein